MSGRRAAPPRRPTIESSSLYTRFAVRPRRGAASTSQGHPRTIFRRALVHDNLLVAEATARKICPCFSVRFAPPGRAPLADTVLPLPSGDRHGDLLVIVGHRPTEIATVRIKDVARVVDGVPPFPLTPSR